MIRLYIRVSIIAFAFAGLGGALRACVMAEVIAEQHQRHVSQIEEYAQ